jgi:hypothetical protein
LGPDRLGIIGITVNGTKAHKYCDGSNWQPGVNQWEDFAGSFVGDPINTSMTANRFDMWAAGTDDALYH